MQCNLSKRAHLVIKNELSRFPDTETGGLLLGYSEAGSDIHILEATDSGYQNVIHEMSCFQYDTAYEAHLCHILSQLYQPPLQLVGVWHKHNSVHSDHDIPFSSADEKMHRQLMQNDGPCISLLFEKSSGQSKKIRYKASVFLLCSNGDHQNISDSTVWDKILSSFPLTCGGQEDPLNKMRISVRAHDDLSHLEVPWNLFFCCHGSFL